MVIIGIDPGLNGGIAIFGEPLLGQKAIPFKTMAEAESFILDYVKSEGVFIKAYIEEPPPYFPGAGGGLASQSKLYRNFGQYEGLLMGIGIPFETATPQKWQKGLPGLAKLKGPDRKKALHNLAAQRYPHLKPTLKTCDAILIAEYGQRLANVYR